MNQDTRHEVEDPAGAPSQATLRAMYLSMVRIRRFEERVAELVEQGEILCPTHLCIGQEGVAVGVCAALRVDDYVFGGHRSHGHYLAKGGNMDLLMAEMDRYLRIVDRLKEVALGYGKSPAQVALRWVLDNQFIAGAIVGAKTPDQVAENVGATGWKLSAGDMAYLGS